MYRVRPCHDAACTDQRGQNAPVAMKKRGTAHKLHPSPPRLLGPQDAMAQWGMPGYGVRSATWLPKYTPTLARGWNVDMMNGERHNLPA